MADAAPDTRAHHFENLPDPDALKSRTRCLRCGAVKPPYQGTGGVVGYLNSLSRWMDRHADACPARTPATRRR